MKSTVWASRCMCRRQNCTVHLVACPWNCVIHTPHCIHGSPDSRDCKSMKTSAMWHQLTWVPMSNYGIDISGRKWCLCKTVPLQKKINKEAFSQALACYSTECFLNLHVEVAPYNGSSTIQGQKMPTTLHLAAAVNGTSKRNKAEHSAVCREQTFYDVSMWAIAIFSEYDWLGLSS